jgi:hypothetical protein
MAFGNCVMGTFAGCFGCLFLLAMIAYQIALIVLAIVEAIHLSKTAHLMNQCDNVWEWILAGCVCLLVWLTSAVYDHIFIPKDKERKQEREANPTSLDKLIHFMRDLANLGLLVVGVWALISAQHPLCKQYWQEHDSIFWDFVIYHAAILFIALGFLAFGILTACGVMCCSAVL